MNVPLMSTYIILLTFILKEISSFITRLPACKYSANYTIKRKGKYFNGNVSLTIPNVAAHKCTLYCTLKDSCLFFNHKVDGTLCELLSSHIGILEDNKKWDVVSTDYSEWKFRGPMCKFLRPACDFEVEYCIDTCESPGYKCNKFVNIAEGKVTRASSLYHSDAARSSAKIVDGDFSTYWKSEKHSTPWIEVDLSAPNKILFVTVVNLPNNNQLNQLSIRISNKNNVYAAPSCVYGQKQNGIEKKNYFCNGGPMIGRYVFALRNTNGYMNVAELMVYSL